MKVRKAIIPCAGFGTRFLPVTKVLPKELLPIVDTPALSYIVDEATASGIEEILIVISPRKKYIKKLFLPDEQLNALLRERGCEKELALINKPLNAKISFATQRKMNGNANAIRLGERFAAGEPVAVLFGDDVMFGDTPVTKQLIDAYELTGGASIVGCQQTPEDVARRCGVMIAGESVNERITEIKGIVEKPTGELPSKLVSLGRFVLSPGIFDAIRNTPLTNGEAYLTDAIGLLANKEKVCACEFEGRIYDIGNKEGYLEAVVEFALRDGNLKDAFGNYMKRIR